MKKTKKMITLRSFWVMLTLILAVNVSAQSNGDKLFMEGQTLQQTQTIAAQNQAIKKFQAAKIVYTTAEKKQMCDNQISICNSNIASLRKGGNRNTNSQPQIISVQETKLALSSNHISFDGDKQGIYSIAVTAPSVDWNFKFLEGIEGEENFVKATRSNDAKSIEIQVEANPYTINRRQNLLVSYENTTDTVHITQSGKEVTLSTDNNLLEFKSKGGNKSIELYTNSDSIIASNNGLTWYIVSKPDWVDLSVEVSKEKSALGKGVSVLKKLVSSTATAAMAEDVKVSAIKVVAHPLLKSDPAFSTGRKGEIVFASQDKTYKITIFQQK